MLPIMEFEKRFRALLMELDQIAEALDDEDLEELNAEFEDALFLLSEIDPRDGDAAAELMDALEEFEALAQGYARWDAARDAAARLEMLVEMARGNA